MRAGHRAPLVVPLADEPRSGCRRQRHVDLRSDGRWLRGGRRQGRARGDRGVAGPWGVGGGGAGRGSATAWGRRGVTRTRRLDRAVRRRIPRSARPASRATRTVSPALKGWHTRPGRPHCTTASSVATTRVRRRRRRIAMDGHAGRTPGRDRAAGETAGIPGPATRDGALRLPWAGARRGRPGAARWTGRWLRTPGSPSRSRLVGGDRLLTAAAWSGSSRRIELRAITSSSESRRTSALRISSSRCWAASCRGERARFAWLGHELLELRCADSHRRVTPGTVR